ncbi:MAG TPA: glutathione peroxidase [Kineosporiaceae bacterium]|nr:glutathione peroxidase [Kineosporiaceae bacterium]
MTSSDALDVPIARLDGTTGTLREIVGPNAALVVNVASRCGLTPQYGALERLQERYGDAGLTVVGVPCNQFGGQEPGTSEEIATFCSTTYGVTFPLTEKVDVNGPDRHPLYQRLVGTPDDRGRTGDIAWNFEKFVVDRSGRVVARFAPTTVPDDPRVVAAVEGVLAAG